MAWRRRNSGVGVLLLGLLATVVLALAAAGPAAAKAKPKSTARACSSYPHPGTIAPASLKIPASLVRTYSVLGRHQRASDRLKASQLSSQLTAADIDLAGIRFLANAAFGAKIYLVPAQHLLSFSLAPVRCLPAGEGSLQKELLPQLKAEYPHWALCLVVIGSNGGSPSCSAADGSPAGAGGGGPTPPEALLYTAGTPGFGLVPNGVPSVTVSYYQAPPLTISVKGNFYVINNPKQAAAPCAAQWLDRAGVVLKTIVGCNFGQYLKAPEDNDIQYVHQTLATLKTQVGQLSAAIAAGNLAAAEQAWLTAHLTWLAIGQDDGAYGAYGDLGGDLDGLSAGHPLGTADPGFTGFHRVEFDLYTNHDLAAAATDTSTLAGILDKIIATPDSVAFPENPNGIAAWILRPHEIIEDAIRDTLSGDDDYGSGTGLASIVADIGADQQLLNLISSVLDPIAPNLIPRAQSELHALQVRAQSTEVNGQWVAVADLSAAQREALDADAGAAAETLSAVPGLLTSIGHAAPTD